MTESTDATFNKRRGEISGGYGREQHDLTQTIVHCLPPQPNIAC
jgi:hypothetical protein